MKMVERDHYQAKPNLGWYHYEPPQGMIEEPKPSKSLFWESFAMEFDVKLHWWNHITYLRFIMVPKNGSSFTEQVESISKPLPCLQNSAPAISPGQKWCQCFVLPTSNFSSSFLQRELEISKENGRNACLPFRQYCDSYTKRDQAQQIPYPNHEECRRIPQVHLTQHVYTNKDPHHNTIYEIL
jgi:hypothetical protein